MTNAQLYYLLNLLIYAGVDIIACLGLSQQFGVAGLTNFGFIIFQAAGAYTAAILSLPAASANGGFQSYIGGWNLPFPVPWIGAAIVGALIIGLATEISAAYITPSYKDVIAFAVLLIMLAVRPSGLLGTAVS